MNRIDIIFRRAYVLGAVLSMFTGMALAQDYTPSAQLTSGVPNARFEIVQSPLAAKWTFRLDRYTGNIWQLVRTLNEDNAWESMPVIDLPRILPATRPRFQLFAGGLAVRHTFLIDTDTGKTWTLTTSKRTKKDGTSTEVSGWILFSE